MGGNVFPPCSLASLLGLLYSVPLTPQQATINPGFCWRLLDTHRQVQLSLLCDHASFLLGPGAHKVLFLPSKSLFPQSCVSSGASMVGLMVTSSKRTYAILKSAAPRASAPVAGHCPIQSVQFSAQLCPTLCDPMNCSTPGLPVHHQLPEFTQTHVH